MAKSTSAETLVYICATATSATTKSALAALTYVEIKGVETLGEIGPQAEDVPFNPLAGTGVQHLKGSTDYGQAVINCARDPLDAGFLAALAASKTKFEYAFKIVLADAADSNDTDTVIYLRGPVMGSRISGLNANGVTMVSFPVGINVYSETPSTAVSGA